MQNLELVITGRDEAKKILLNNIDSAGITHIISIGDTKAPAGPPQVPPAGFKAHHGKKLRLQFDDISIPRGGYKLATDADIQAIINFGLQIKELANGKLLFHCGQGLSRSPAAAFIVLCVIWEEEIKALQAVLKAAPRASPNVWMVSIADRLLGRNGAMSKALWQINAFVPKMYSSFS